MPEQLTFLQPPPPAGAVPAWETLPLEQQQAVRALLARLMRQIVLARRAPQSPEHPDD
jgi:hypothetical protein